MQEHKNFIYGLFDLEDWKLRYVGQTSCGMKRPHDHLRPTALKPHTRLARWLRGLQVRGLKPGIGILAEHSSPETLNDGEIFAIAYYRYLGYDLINGTDGGDGYRGPHSPEHTAKVAAANRGKKRTPEQIARMAAIKRGTKQSAETVAKRIAKNRGQKRTPEQRARMSAAMRGVPKPPEAVRAMTERQIQRVGRPVVDQNGTVYRTTEEAGRATGVTGSAVRAILRGKRSWTRSGYTFRYLNP